MRILKPWAYGPFEILLHAELHYRAGEDSDRRIAMIGFDMQLKWQSRHTSTCTLYSEVIGHILR